MYGTLRPGNSPTFEIPGELYDLGWYPGIKLVNPTNSRVVVEMLEVSDHKLKQLDQYEGYHENDEKSSLYLRREINVEIDTGPVKGWIYVYNHDINSRFPYIPGGDWLSYRHKDKDVDVIEEVGVA